MIQWFACFFVLLELCACLMMYDSVLPLLCSRVVGLAGAGEGQ